MSLEATSAVTTEPLSGLVLAQRRAAPYLFEDIHLHAYQGPAPVAYDEHLSELQTTDQRFVPVIGLLGAQLHIRGELVGDEIGTSEVVFPRDVTNILLIMRNQVMDARISLSNQFCQGMMLGDRTDPVGALLHGMYKKPLGHQGYAYTAVVAISELLRKGNRTGREVSYAAGKTAAKRLFLPQTTD